MNVDHRKLRGRPRKAAADRDADRQGFVAAAFDILREGGSSALTARAVAARAGTAVGTVYTVFDTLDALHLEVNALTMGLLKDHLARALARLRDQPIEARLLGLAEAYIGFADLHRPLWSALFEPRAAAAPPAVAAHICDLFALLEDVLRDAGGIEPGDVPLLARALWSSVHGAVFLAEAGGLGPIGRDDVPAMVAALVRAVVAGSTAGGSRSGGGT